VVKHGDIKGQKVKIKNQKRRNASVMTVRNSAGARPPRAQQLG